VCQKSLQLVHAHGVQWTTNLAVFINASVQQGGMQLMATFSVSDRARRKQRTRERAPDFVGGGAAGFRGEQVAVIPVGLVTLVGIPCVKHFQRGMGSEMNGGGLMWCILSLKEHNAEFVCCSVLFSLSSCFSNIRLDTGSASARIPRPFIRQLAYI